MLEFEAFCELFELALPADTVIVPMLFLPESKSLGIKPFTVTTAEESGAIEPGMLSNLILYLESAVDANCKLETTVEPSFVTVIVVLMFAFLSPLSVGAEIWMAETVLKQNANIV